MSLLRNPGRVAGLWYLLLIVAGPLRLLYIPAKLFVTGNAAATAANIAAHETLFRLGIASDLACAVILILLTMALYRLFRDVDAQLAALMVILGGVMPALLYFVNAASDLGVLMVVRGADYLSAFSKPQQDALALLLLRIHDFQNTAAEMLWGAWLIPLAILTLRSRLLPRFLGVWLAAGGIVYIIMCLTGVMLPQYQDQVFLISRPARLGEVAFMIWLLVKGSSPGTAR